jgi:hypothetical protein
MRRRATLCAIAATVSLAACAGKKVDDPRVELTDVGYALHLPPAMQAALNADAPGFHAVMQASYRSDVPQAAAAATGHLEPLFAAVGDFDADGTVDAVVEGSVPSDSALHVIAIMNGAHPRAVDVTRFESYDADAVGVYLTRPPAGQAGAFEVVNYPDETTMYRYQGDGFIGTKVSG